MKKKTFSPILEKINSRKKSALEVDVFLLYLFHPKESSLVYSAKQSLVKEANGGFPDWDPDWVEVKKVSAA